MVWWTENGHEYKLFFVHWPSSLFDKFEKMTEKSEALFSVIWQYFASNYQGAHFWLCSETQQIIKVI